MLGNVDFFESDLVEEQVKPLLACEHEKLRRAASIMLCLLCYRAEQRADQVVKFMMNFTTAQES